MELDMVAVLRGRLAAVVEESSRVAKATREIEIDSRAFHAACAAWEDWDRAPGPPEVRANLKSWRGDLQVRRRLVRVWAEDVDRRHLSCLIALTGAIAPWGATQQVEA